MRQARLVGYLSMSTSTSAFMTELLEEEDRLKHPLRSSWRIYQTIGITMSRWFNGMYEVIPT